MRERVFSITKMKMENAFLEISLGRLEELDFRGGSVDISKIVTIVSDTFGAAAGYFGGFEGDKP